MHSTCEIKPLSLLLVDDHPLFAEGLIAALKAQRNGCEITHAPSISEAMQAIEAMPEDFDLILLDLSLPDGGGLDLINHLKANRLFIPCVVLSASEQRHDIQSSLNAGASGYVTKAHSGKEILSFLDAVLAGEVVTPLDFDAAGHADHDITPRQLQVLELLAKGLSNKLISRALSLSEHTVKSHIKALYLCLDAHSRTECVSIARTKGLLP